MVDQKLYSFDPVTSKFQLKSNNKDWFEIETTFGLIQAYFYLYTNSKNFKNDIRTIFDQELRSSCKKF